MAGNALRLGYLNIRIGRFRPISFYQATPVPLRPYPVGQTVRTTAEQGWDKLRNGD